MSYGKCCFGGPGVRRSACISFFDIDDEEMLTCKQNFELVSFKSVIQETLDRFGNKLFMELTTIEQGTGITYKLLDIIYNDPAYGLQTKRTKVPEDDISWFLEKDRIVPWYYIQEQRGRANNSVALVRHKLKKKDFNSVLMRTKNSKAGEPGVFLTNNPDILANPCIVGDTLIAVADGRNAVNIRTLAEEGKDIPVYSTSPITGKIEIKYGRQPRKTRR